MANDSGEPVDGKVDGKGWACGREFTSASQSLPGPRGVEYSRCAGGSHAGLSTAQLGRSQRRHTQAQSGLWEGPALC